MRTLGRLPEGAHCVPPQLSGAEKSVLSMSVVVNGSHILKAVNRDRNNALLLGGLVY